MKNSFVLNAFLTVVGICFLSAGQALADGLTFYSDSGQCAKAQEAIASHTNQYIENFKACYSLVKNGEQGSSPYKELIAKSNEIRLSIEGELYNCGYYCDNPTPCMKTLDQMLSKKAGGKAIVACWGDAW